MSNFVLLVGKVTSAPSGNPVRFHLETLDDDPVTVLVECEERQGRFVSSYVKEGSEVVAEGALASRTAGLVVLARRVSFLRDKPKTDDGGGRGGGRR